MQVEGNVPAEMGSIQSKKTASIKKKESDLELLNGIGSKGALLLHENGIHSIENLAGLSAKHLEGIQGIGPKTAEKYVQLARNHLHQSALTPYMTTGSPSGKDGVKKNDSGDDDYLKKILRGCVESNVWIQDPANWDEYKSILKQFLCNPDLSDEQIREFMKQGKLFDPQMLLEHNQQKLTDYFTQFRAFLAAEGALKADLLKDYTYENVIKNSFPEAEGSCTAGRAGLHLCRLVEGPGGRGV